jgi:hypothetical protein
MSEEAHKDPVRLEHAPFYAELAAATNYSFLRGASHPSDMVARALELGMSGIGIADRNTVAGVVRAHAALKEARAKAMATGLPTLDDSSARPMAGNRTGWSIWCAKPRMSAMEKPCPPMRGESMRNSRSSASRTDPVPGAGSAANSAVCFLLGITSVDPTRHDLLFSRFISAERKEPPDIDVDFEHERREEVIQYIYAAMGASAPALPRRSSTTARAARSARSARRSA